MYESNCLVVWWATKQKVLRASQEKKKESYYAFRNQESFVQALITRDIYPLSRFVFHFVPYMIRSTAGDFFLV